MTSALEELVAWVDEVSALRPEGEVTLKVANVDNPGWLIELDAFDVGLDPEKVMAREERRADGSWLSLHSSGRTLVAVCGPRGAGLAAAAILEAAVAATEGSARHV